MNILKRNTNRKHIQLFESLISKELCKHEPKFGKAMDLTKLDSLHFSYKPSGISIVRGYRGQTEYLETQKDLRSYFELLGVKLFHKKKNKFENVKIFFQDYSISFIEVDQPNSFHKIFDLEKFQLENIKLNHIKTKNPDKDIVINILKGLDSQTLDKLDLDSTFEIEINGLNYYPIIDFEDGNYLAVDRRQKIYRLIHDHEEPIRQIADSAFEFFKQNSENRNELKQYLNK